MKNRRCGRAFRSWGAPGAPAFPLGFVIPLAGRRGMAGDLEKRIELTEKYEMDWIIDWINGENGQVDTLKGADGE